ncbi:hypothetical protein Pflav_016460 [Phytohabitans flavus]|uniref:Uncharacterized protein n=1 Tax=Phytohabitans flavus TaxID=1076124 RepID=A0A6F8XN42_9ACTN|nr:hypothetical protein [Phytohabitans flavus]BCB75236.1 hypothetical protein Pflav_016460 [Phytohabitans flavus]
MKTVARAATPTQSPLLDEYCAGTCAFVAASTGANRSLLETSDIAGEFSVMNTSAGDAAPSAAIWLASSKSLPLRTSTLMPVLAVKPSAQACPTSSCWAL